MVLAQLSCTIFYKEKTGLVLQCRDQEELERMLRERTSSGLCIIETEFKNRNTLEKLKKAWPFWYTRAPVSVLYMGPRTIRSKILI